MPSVSELRYIIDALKYVYNFIVELHEYHEPIIQNILPGTQILLTGIIYIEYGWDCNQCMADLWYLNQSFEWLKPDTKTIDFLTSYFAIDK